QGRAGVRPPSPSSRSRRLSRMGQGRVVAGRFEIERLAGEGGMGAVYRAHDRVEGLPVALKLLHGDSAADVERFQREARLLAALSHPAIVRYVAHGVTAGERYLAMEWLEGSSLEERLAHGPLSLRETVTLGRRLSEALAHAHGRGVLHRDIKPSNI